MLLHCCYTPKLDAVGVAAAAMLALSAKQPVVAAVVAVLREGDQAVDAACCAQQQQSAELLACSRRTERVERVSIGLWLWEQAEVHACCHAIDAVSLSP